MQPAKPSSVSATRALSVLLAISAVACASCSRSHSNARAASAMLGTWRLASLEEGGADGSLHRADCTGLLVLTHEGRMAVQLMYRETRTAAGAAPAQYAQGGYEASFGRFQIDEPGRSFTYHVEGALVRALVGKDLKRLYQLSGTQLVVTPSTRDEHWRATWERDWGGR